MAVVMVLVETVMVVTGRQFHAAAAKFATPSAATYHDLRSTLFRSSRIRNSSGQEKVY